MDTNSAVMEPKPVTLFAFIKAHGDPAKGPQAESVRLMPLIEAAGIKTTVGSVRQALTKIRRERGLSNPLRKPNSPKNKKKMVTQQNPRITALTSYIDDAVNGLTLLKGEIKRLQDVEKKYLAIKAQIEK